MANTIVTIAKVVPILTFIAIAAVGFKAGLFTADFWGRATDIDGVPLGVPLCGDDAGNYTEGSAYQANIRVLASVFPKNASSSPA